MTDETTTSDSETLEALQAALTDGRQSQAAKAIARGVGRMPDMRRLAPARRRQMQLSIARTAALRLAHALDPY